MLFFLAPVAAPAATAAAAAAVAKIAAIIGGGVLVGKALYSEGRRKGRAEAEADMGAEHARRTTRPDGKEAEF